MQSNLVRKGQDLVKSMEGQNLKVDNPDRVISLCGANQRLVKDIVEALSKAEKRIKFLENEVLCLEWDISTRS